MSDFHAAVYRMMNRNPGMTYREACRSVGRAGGKKRKKAEGKGEKAGGPAKREDARRREYIRKMEAQGLW